MNASGLTWIAALPILAGLAAVAQSMRTASERRAAPSMLALGGLALALTMVAQLGNALFSTELTRVLDSGPQWLATDGFELAASGFGVAPSTIEVSNVRFAPGVGLGLVGERTSLVALAAMLLIGVVTATRSASSAPRLAATGWLTVALGASAYTVITRSGIGVLAGWWMAGWALRRLGPDGVDDSRAVLLHRISDVAAAVALCLAFEASGTWDLVAQRVASVGPLREPWIEAFSLTRADVIVASWTAALGARVVALTRTPGVDAVDVAVASGAATTIPWIAVAFRLGPWLGSAPEVGALAILLASLLMIGATLRAGDEAAHINPEVGASAVVVGRFCAALARVGPALAVVAVFAGGGFAAVELAIVHALALPVVAASMLAQRRDLLARLGGWTLAGCAPLAGVFAYGRGVGWGVAHESAWNPWLDVVAGGSIAIVWLVLAWTVAGALRRGSVVGTRIDGDTVMLRVGLVGLALAVGVAILPERIGLDALGGPGRLAESVGALQLYGPAAVGDASRFFVGAREAVASTEHVGWLAPRLGLAAHGVGIAAWFAWWIGDRRARTGANLGHAGVVGLRGIESMTRLPGAALGIVVDAVAGAVELVLVRGLARDGDRGWRTLRDRASALRDRLLAGDRIGWTMVVLVLAVLGWLFVKPSVSTLAPTDVHGFGGLHYRMRAVADPGRERKRESDEAREILERAAAAEVSPTADPDSEGGTP